MPALMDKPTVTNKSIHTLSRYLVTSIAVVTEGEINNVNKLKKKKMFMIVPGDKIFLPIKALRPSGQLRGIRYVHIHCLPLVLGVFLFLLFLLSLLLLTVKAKLFLFIIVSGHL